MSARALRRPAAPRPDGAAAPVVRQRDLPAGDELKAALAVLQLGAVPTSVRELHGMVSQRHPRPERSWSWELAAAYRRVFTLAVEAGRARAAAKREARKQESASSTSQVVRTIG